MRSAQVGHAEPRNAASIDKRVGSIDVGKDADLVIYNHDPLSAYAVVQKTLIDGRVYFDRQRDIAQRPNAKRKGKRSSTRKRNPPEKKPGCDRNGRPETGTKRNRKRKNQKKRARRKTPNRQP